MIQFYDARWQCLPSSEELPDSDDTSADRLADRLRELGIDPDTIS